MPCQYGLFLFRLDDPLAFLGLYAICVPVITPLRPLTKPSFFTIMRTKVLIEHLGYLDAVISEIPPAPARKDGVVMGFVIREQVKHTVKAHITEDFHGD